jgi:hypothetical protein
VKVIIWKLLPNVQIALQIAWQEQTQRLFDHGEVEAWGPQDIIEPATRAIIKHADVVHSLWHQEIVSAANDGPGADIAVLSDLHLHHLLVHQFV